MPYADERGAVAGAPSDQQTDRRVSHREPTASEGAAVAAGLRRRRRASLRCVPLVDGRRDPLDPLPAGRPTARELAAWQAAAAHLRMLGWEPVIPEQVSRANRCRCGAES